MKQYLCLITILFSSYTLKAQSGSWVWLKGANTGGSLGNYGTMGVSSPTNEPPARYQAAYWTDKNGNFWLFGGVDGFNDLWKYNPISNEWTWVKGPQLKTNMSGVYGTKGVPSSLNNPPALGYGANCWTDSTGDLWLFAGVDLGAYSLKDVVWRYNIATNEWTWMKGVHTSGTSPIYGVKGVEGPSFTPGGRSECKSAWVYNNKLWLFGGDNEGNAFNDLWSYNIKTNNWTWESGTTLLNDNGNYGKKGVEAATNIPPARASYTRWQDKNNNFYLFSGVNLSNQNCYNDVWKFNHTSNKWTWISGTNIEDDLGTKTTFCNPDTANIPGSRYENQTAQTNSKCTKAFWTFGGANRSGSFFNELWLFNVSNLEWTKVKGDSGGPPPFSYGSKGVVASNNMIPGKIGSSVWTDKKGVLYVFGGYFINPVLELSNDLWKFIPDTACIKTGIVSGIELEVPSDTELCEGDTIKMPIPFNCIINVQPSTGRTIDMVSGYIKFYGTTNSKYTVIATSLDPNDPCFTNDTITFSIKGYPLPNADFSINPSSAIISNPIFNFLNTSSNAERFEWYYNGKLISTSRDLVQNFPTIGKHCLTLVAINGCGQRDSLTQCCNVYVKGKLSVPNAFTPNGDSKNDLFRAIISSPIQKFSLLIVNRYGQEIFKSDNPYQAWDGRFNNQDQEVGVYYYLIKVKFDYPDAAEEMYKGDINLLR